MRDINSGTGITGRVYSCLHSLVTTTGEVMTRLLKPCPYWRLQSPKNGIFNRLNNTDIREFYTVDGILLVFCPDAAVMADMQKKLHFCR